MGNTYNRVYNWCCKYGENRCCERCANKKLCASKHTGLLNSCLGKLCLHPYLVVPLISARVTLISTRVSAHCQGHPITGRPNSALWDSFTRTRMLTNAIFASIFKELDWHIASEAEKNIRPLKYRFSCYFILKSVVSYQKFDCYVFYCSAYFNDTSVYVNVQMLIHWWNHWWQALWHHMASMSHSELYSQTCDWVVTGNK